MKNCPKNEAIRCILNNLQTYSNYYKVIINEYYIIAGLLKKYKMLSIGNAKSQMRI